MSVYQIRVESLLDESWANQLVQASVEHDVQKHETLITCLVVDQAQLHGILRKLYNLGLTLVSLQRVEEPEGEES